MVQGLRLWHLCLVAMLLTPTIGAAQRVPIRDRVSQRQAQRQTQRQLADTAAGRARLEQEVRRNFARVVRQQVGLSDDQMRRLVPVTQRYELQRRQLLMRERDARLSLRDIVVRGQAADSAQVDRLLATLVDVQKRRVEILEAEQRELGGFMSPLQRAKFMAVQEQIRRRLEQMRQRRVP